MIKRNNLKVIAFLAMTIDHIGLVLCNNLPILRMIGRIAFPIFAYQIVDSYFYTSNRNMLKLRLLITALISQPIFAYVFNTYYFNIFFSLLLYLILIDIFEIINQHIYQPTQKILIEYFILLALSLLDHNGLMPIDWGSDGFYIVTLFYWLKKRYISYDNFLLLFTLYIASIIFFQYEGYLYLGSLAALYLIFDVKYTKDIHLYKYFGYFYYPLHLLIILYLKYFII